MNVLISDEDTQARHVVGQVLTQRCGVDILEAANGLEALDKLQQQSFGALIMEARMPIMGGLETLQILRESPQFACLPVIILTNERDERLLKRFIALGVRDVVFKPTGAEQFAERFERLLKPHIPNVPNGRRVPAGTNTEGVSHLSHGASALIVDGDVHYRKFFRRVAEARFSLLEAGSNANALEMCLKCPPDAVFLGTNLGVIGYERMVTRLRAKRQGRHLSTGHHLCVQARR